MSDLVIPDPYESVYEFEKMKNPNFQYTHVQVPKVTLRAVDSLLNKVGARDDIKTESDWLALEEVFKFYEAFWPDDARDFKKAIPDIRSISAPGGYSESKEIRYVGAVPPILMRLMKIVFPNQQWDKKFSNRFVQKYKTFDVGGRT